MTKSHGAPREPRSSAPILTVVGIVLFSCWAALPDFHLLTDGVRLIACLWSVIPWSLFVGLVALDRRGTVDAGLHTLGISALFFPLFLMGGSQVAIWANANWATAPARQVEVKVLDLTHDPESSDLYVSVVGLDGAARTTLVVDEWKILNPGHVRALRLSIRDGRFGWTYIADLEEVVER